MAVLELKHTPVFTKNWEVIQDKSTRFIINQGGSRSSKTYSLCQIVIVYCLSNPKVSVSIVRKTFPTLRGSVMRDFFEVMKGLSIYEQKNHNKTENIYYFDNGSSVEFFAVDDEQKLRGRKRDVLWANEANDLNFEEFNQLNMRTSAKLIFDFNPSDNFHWLYDLIARENSKLIHSTYKDNPFLPESQVKEIEELINVDEGYYRVYALGEKSTGKTTIYTGWKYYDWEIEPQHTIWGLDFGYNHPSALTRVDFIENKAFVQQIIYENRLTSQDLINKMNVLGVSKKDWLVCDGARPEIIEDLRRSGYNTQVADKSVKAGIDSVKSCELFIHKESQDLIKEIMSYKWKSSGDVVLDEPVKIWDDLMDSMRYAIHYWNGKNKKRDPKSFKIFF